MNLKDKITSLLGLSIEDSLLEDLDNTDFQSKIDRSAFLYLEPTNDSSGPNNEFAQCSSCIFLNTKAERCHIHSSDTPIDGDDSCGFYLNGPTDQDFSSLSLPTLSPEESGLVKHKVRCGNCISYNPKVRDGICNLYSKLNKELPTIFDLDENVSKFACCNAQKPKNKQ